MDDLERLKVNLEEAGKATELIAFEGARLLILPYGGRVLGIAPEGCARNLFWTNPAFKDATEARDFFRGPGWPNSGGNRTWIAPELDFFFPQFPALNEYVQPRQLDPGNFVSARSGHSVSLTNKFVVRSFRFDEEVRLALVKIITPLRYRGEPLRAGVRFAGYRQETKLNLLSPPVRWTKIALWDLLQLPHGGDLRVPTRFRTTPKPWFGEIPLEDLEVVDDVIRYRMRASGGQKIGLKAAAVTGIMAYRFPMDGSAALVVRRFDVAGEGDYLDLPWTDWHDSGYAVQACNVDNQYGAFSEMEYHAPAAPEGSRDTSELWTFVGDPDSIDVIERRIVTDSAHPLELNDRADCAQ